MDFLGGLLGGDIGGSVMQGMKMAQMERQMQMQEQKVKQDYELSKLVKEEQALKLKAQRTQMDNAGKLAQQWSGDDSPLMQATKGIYGDNQAALISEIMRTSPETGIGLLKELKPQEGYKVVGDRVFQMSPTGLTEVVGSNKAPTVRTMNVNGMEVSQQWNPNTKTWDETARGPKWNPDKQGRETPEETGNKVKARLLAKVEAFKEMMGREPNAQEKRAMMINDPYGILGGAEDSGPVAPTTGGTKFKQSDVVKTGTHKSGKKVFLLKNGMVVDANGNRVQ
jgi:hypothetical protein